MDRRHRGLQRIATADVCVVGAGAAGCVIAARLSEDASRRVCLVEAGPDYGHYDDARWPDDLLDASDCATSHDWGYAVDSCCRVVGGSSAHNGCLVVWGAPADYDEWAAVTGDPGWGFEAFAPYLRRAERTIATRPFAADELHGWTRRAIDGWGELGEPALEAFNAPDAVRGWGLVPVNRRGRVRVHAAFAYLDPARGRPGLRIVADALADRVVVDGGRARGVVVWRNGVPGLIEADTVVMTASAYGTPAILLRSGVGPADELRRLGIPVVADVQGVGRGLTDHPCVDLEYDASPSFAAELAADDERGVLTHVQVKLKTASARCAPGAFDLQVMPNVAWERDGAGRRTGRHLLAVLPVLLKPRSRGTVRLRATDPDVPPDIDRNLFSDPEGRDLAALADGVQQARALAASSPVATSLRGGRTPSAPADHATLEAWLRGSAYALFHPSGTCRLGTAADELAVADADGRVRGVDGLRVADASAFPSIPRANTHLSVLALAERLAERIAAH